MTTPFHESASAGPAAALAAGLQERVPGLETDRLILRAPRIEDFQVFADIVLGPQGRFYGAPQDRKAAWREFMQITGTWYFRGHGAWAAASRDSGDVLGFVNIGAEPGDMEPELGFLVAAEAEGKGIAAEAGAAVLEYAFGTLALDSLVSYVDPLNARSCRLLERLGARRDPAAEAALPGDDKAFVFRHARQEART